jgi:hypothetical protein
LVTDLGLPDVAALPLQYRQKLAEVYRAIAYQLNGISEGSITARHNASTAAPTGAAQAYQKGDFVPNSNPTETGTAPNTYIILGWICTVAGSPGTWEECRVLTDGFSGWVLLSSQTASSSANINFAGATFPTTYTHYLVRIRNLVPATDNVELWLRTSSDAGSTYDSGASDYRHSRNFLTELGTNIPAGSSADTKILINEGCGSATGEVVNADIYIDNASSTALYKTVRHDTSIYSASALYSRLTGGGARVSTSAVTALRFLMSSGNIASGRFDLYGMQ